MKKPFVIVMAVLLFCSLTACVDQIPLSPKALSETPTPVPSLTTGNLPVITTVLVPWKTGDWQKGIQVYWHTNNDSTTVIKHKADRILDYIVSLDANSVVVSFPLYVDGPKPSRVYAGDGTPSSTEIQIVIREAQVRKLRIALRPIIDETNIVVVNKNAWRGSIIPTNLDTWFTSYQEAIHPYLQLAKMNRIDEFVVGTELSSLQADTTRWNALLATAKASYSGVLSYAENWDEYQNHRYGPASQLGVDAYPHFTLGDDASVDHLTAAWVGWINATRPAVDSLTIQEVGIPAQSGMYDHPGNWGGGKLAINQTIQANWFTAACNAAKQTGIAGIYFWKIDINTDPAAANPNTDQSTSFIARAGQDSIKTCFAS